MQRSVLLRRLRSVARTRVVLVALVAVAPVVAVGCASGHYQGEAALPATASSPPSTSSRSSAPMPSPASAGTAGPRNTVAPVTAVPPDPAVLHLLADLRSVPFRSPLPPHLRVRGVGIWTYIDAGHAGSGYAGSAQVLIRSGAETGTITAIYDVFAAASQATARFKVAESNFSRYGLGGGFRLLHLSPAVSAFCGSRAGPAGPTTCWFNYKVTNGNVTTTAPPVYGGDGPAVLQAMLSHLLALTG
jgi:hypothetical protein